MVSPIRCRDVAVKRCDQGAYRLDWMVRIVIVIVVGMLSCGNWVPSASTLVVMWFPV
jgi:hypothetical protein